MIILQFLDVWIAYLTVVLVFREFLSLLLGQLVELLDAFGLVGGLLGVLVWAGLEDEFVHFGGGVMWMIHV